MQERDRAADPNQPNNKNSKLVFVGVREFDGEGVPTQRVFVIEPRREPMELSHICKESWERGKRHVEKYGCHSPDGFNWGYSGSGPAELALMMLLEIGYEPDEAWFWHQRVKQRFIAGLPNGSDTPWTIQSKNIIDWTDVLDAARNEDEATPRLIPFGSY